MADNDFERAVEIQFKAYANQNKAHFDKLYPPIGFHGMTPFLIGKSTVDYIGIYEGNFIALEAKECKKETFPMANIKPHQINHLKTIIFHGGHSYIIVKMSIWNKIYLIPITDGWLKAHWEPLRKPSMDEKAFELFGKEIKLPELINGIAYFIACGL
jgi:penicillin-binding protein-related factor A (putative recombinase)